MAAVLRPRQDWGRSEPALDRNEIVSLLETYGGAYGLNHTRRILHLVSCIGAGQVFSEEVLWISAHLHDWGGYAPWATPGVDHAVRSVQVAEGFLEANGYRGPQRDRVLECIENHHNGRRDKCLEAQLLSDADALDYLGVVGILREFSTKPRELRKAFDGVRSRRAKLESSLIFDTSRRIAEERIARMEPLLQAFQEESFGLF